MTLPLKQQVDKAHCAGFLEGGPCLFLLRLIPPCGACCSSQPSVLTTWCGSIGMQPHRGWVALMRGGISLTERSRACTHTRLASRCVLNTLIASTAVRTRHRQSSPALDKAAWVYTCSTQHRRRGAGAPQPGRNCTSMPGTFAPRQPQGAEHFWCTSHAYMRIHVFAHVPPHPPIPVRSPCS